MYVKPAEAWWTFFAYMLSQKLIPSDKFFQDNVRCEFEALRWKDVKLKLCNMEVLIGTENCQLCIYSDKLILETH